MIVVQNVGNGTYSFVWDGGNSIITAKASSWNSGNGVVSLQWVDEFGDVHFINSTNSDTTFGSNHPAGSYNLVISGSPTNVSITIRKVPA